MRRESHQKSLQLQRILDAKKEEAKKFEESTVQLKRDKRDAMHKTTLTNTSIIRVHEQMSKSSEEIDTLKDELEAVRMKWSVLEDQFQSQLSQHKDLQVKVVELEHECCEALQELVVSSVQLLQD